MAAIHTPTALSTAMGLIAAVLIGDIAINVGLFSPEVILYVSLSAIGAYTTPSYELSLANKMVKLFMLILVALFKVEGFVIGLTILTIVMTSIRSLRTPYLWPLLPFNGKAFWHVLVRTSVPGEKSGRASFIRETAPDSREDGISRGFSPGKSLFFSNRIQVFGSRCLCIRSQRSRLPGGCRCCSVF